jgi:hypothetical protein
MARQRVVVPSHIFHDLAPERAVLEPRGIEVVDGSALAPEACWAAVRDAEALLCQLSWLETSSAQCHAGTTLSLTVQGRKSNVPRRWEGRKGRRFRRDREAPQC